MEAEHQRGVWRQMVFGMVDSLCSVQVAARRSVLAQIQQVEYEQQQVQVKACSQE